MATVVKILKDDDGYKPHNQKWHYVHAAAGEFCTFCTGEFFGMGVSAVEYKIKEGKITCPECISMIKTIKSVKL